MSLADRLKKAKMKQLVTGMPAYLRTLDQVEHPDAMVVYTWVQVGPDRLPLRGVERYTLEAVDVDDSIVVVRRGAKGDSPKSARGAVHAIWETDL